MEKPQQLEGMVRYIQNNVVGSPWCDALVLAMAVEYSHKVQYKTLLAAVTTLHRGLRSLFSTFSLEAMNQWEVDKHLSLYLSHQVIIEDTSSQRVAFWQAYQTASRHVKHWLNSLPSEQQKQYGRYIFPYPDDPLEMARLSERRTYLYERQQKRKEDTDAIMPF
jgi:hypothetical protein